MDEVRTIVLGAFQEVLRGDVVRQPVDNATGSARGWLHVGGDVVADVTERDTCELRKSVGDVGVRCADHEEVAGGLHLDSD